MMIEFMQGTDIQFKNYGFSGNKSLGLIWDKISKNYNFFWKKSNGD